MRHATVRRRGEIRRWTVKFGTDAVFVEAEDCGSAGVDGSTDDSEELAKAGVIFSSHQTVR